MITNGSEFDKKWVSRIKNETPNMLPGLSLEGFEEVNDSIRGAGSFKKTVEIATWSGEAGIPFLINTTISSETINHVLTDSFFKFLEDLGPVMLGIYKYRETNTRNDRHLMLGHDDLEFFKTFINQADQRYLFFINHEEPKITKDGGIHRKCKGLLTIGLDGAVKMCPSLRNPFPCLKRFDREYVQRVLKDWYQYSGSVSDGCPVYFNPDSIETFNTRVSTTSIR